ncbi:MAG: glycosyltransferase family 2 protein [Kiritimatiellia bacterium]|jgi:rhamnosyltransferase
MIQQTKNQPHPPTANSASVIIPIINAATLLPDLLDRLESQQPAPPAEIILVDSGSTDNPQEIVKQHERARIIPIEKFSHGRSRNLGAQAASGEFVVLMTQDALPHDNQWLAALLAPLADPAVAAAFSRQIPRADAPPTEKFFLNYHFPPGAQRRQQAGDNATPAFARTVFFSNVSAVIRRECLLQHPFDETLIMSEDQQVARDLLAAGYAIVYEPASAVIHSHRYSLNIAFRRYFDSVYSLTKIFPQHDMHASASLGLSYLRKEVGFILRRYPWYLPYYLLYTIAKTGGTIAGHYAERLPRRLTRLCSLHRYHWDDAT